MIEGFLERFNDDKVCTLMLWERALGNDLDHKKPDKADQTQIGLIMSRMPGWKRCQTKINFGDTYGLQKHWKRIEQPQFIEIKGDADMPF